MFSPDLVAVDGGVIDRLGTVDLRYEASFILDNGINDLAEIRDGGHPVTRTKTGEYKIEGKGQDRSYNAVQSYGTARMSSYQIFENLQFLWFCDKINIILIFPCAKVYSAVRNE